MLWIFHVKLAVLLLCEKYWRNFPWVNNYAISMESSVVLSVAQGLFCYTLGFFMIQANIIHHCNMTQTKVKHKSDFKLIVYIHILPLLESYGVYTVTISRETDRVAAGTHKANFQKVRNCFIIEASWQIGLPNMRTLLPAAGVKGRDVITCPCPWYLLLVHKSSYRSY